MMKRIYKIKIWQHCYHYWWYHDDTYFLL